MPPPGDGGGGRVRGYPGGSGLFEFRDQLADHLLGVAEEHAAVGGEVQLVLDAGEAGVQGALDYYY